MDACRRIARSRSLIIAVALFSSTCRSTGDAVVRDEGRLGAVRIYMPRGSEAGLVFVFSDQAGWTVPLSDVARHLAARGAIVVGVDLPSYLDGLRRSADGCHYVVAELEDLSHRLERERGFGAYHAPVFAGVGAGATLAYAALAQAPAATVAGAAGLDPAPAVATRVPLCPGAPSSRDPHGGFRYAAETVLSAPWRVGTTGGRDGADALVELVAPLLATAPGTDAITAARPDLPLVVLPAAGDGRLAAIIYSGDGGWRDLDKTIGETLAGRGVPVVGVDSLRYFWSAKSPARVAGDLAAIMAAARTAWGDREFVLVGYSFGAGILPFAVNRLPAADRDRIVEVSLLGLEPRAPFEIKVAGILGRAPSEDAPLVLPEVRHLDPDLLQCFYGEQEPASVCRDPALSQAELVHTAGGHHFDGNYVGLAERILAGARRRMTTRGTGGSVTDG